MKFMLGIPDLVVEQYEFVLQTKLDNQNTVKTKLGSVGKPVWVLQKTT